MCLQCVGLSASVFVAAEHLTIGLHAAVRHKHVSAARCVLTAGADAEGLDDDGARPLHWAVLSGCEECVKVILRAKSKYLSI